MIDKIIFDKFLKEKNLQKYKDEMLEQLETSIKKILNDKIKELKNKKRIIINDNAKEHFLATDILSKQQIQSLPHWVKHSISEARIIGSSKKIIQTKDGKKYHINNKLNDLSGAEWTFFLNSVISTRYSINGKDSFAYHIRKIHPSPKPPQLMREIIEFFTKEGEIVLDYFMGVGGTLLGASLCNRKAIGIDLNTEFIKAYREANLYLKLKEQIAIQADSIDFLKNGIERFLNEEKVSLILIDPPYGDMLSRPKTGEAFKKDKDKSPTPFSDSELDLGNMSWNDFLGIFHQSILDSMKYLKNKGHIVVFIKDMQPKQKELNLLHIDIIRDLNTIDNLNYLGMKIWADQSVNLYPYGYPFGFVANQIHQYIMIFQKVENGK